MNELVEKILKLKTSAKVGICVGMAMALGGIYYTLFYADLEEQIAQSRGQLAALQEERTSYEKRKTEYLAYRNELTQLQEKQRELLRALPRAQEIPTFIGSIQEQAELAGLEVVRLSIDPEIPEQLYVKIPVRMEVRGPFHNVTRFFKNVSDLRRIVNIEELKLAPEGTSMGAELTNSDAPVRQNAQFIAATFRYNEASGGQ